MTHAPENEEPGFENDVNEVPHAKDNGDEDTLEEKSEAEAMEEVQAEAAEERKEGGYQ